MWERRIAPLAGVAAALLLIGSALLIGNFEFMPPAEEVVAFYESDPIRTMVGAYVGVLASFFVLWFAGSVCQAMRDMGEDRLGLIGFGGGVFAGVMIAFGYLVQTAGSERARIHGTIGADGATTLFDLSSLAVGTGAAIGLAALVGAFGIAAFASGAYPRWLGVASGLIALGLISPVNYVVMALALVWVPVVGVILYRRQHTSITEVGAGV